MMRGICIGGQGRFLVGTLRGLNLRFLNLSTSSSAYRLVAAFRIRPRRRHVFAGFPCTSTICNIYCMTRNALQHVLAVPAIRLGGFEKRDRICDYHGEELCHGHEAPSNSKHPACLGDSRTTMAHRRTSGLVSH